MNPRLLLPAVLLPLTLSAQPVLDFNTTATLPGESYIYHASPWHDPGSAGMDQTWDFSAFVTDSLIYINFVDPATTPDGALFPNATIAALDTGGIFAYSAFTTAGGEFQGLSIPGLGAIVYSDPMSQGTFPCTYNTTWTDNLAAEFVLGLPTVRTGTTTGTADGYGTLILPWGSITDVLRITYVEDYADSNAFSVTTTHREYTDFHKAGTHYPLAHILSITVTNIGGTFTTSGSQWMDETTTLVAAATATPRVEAYPVPANDVLNVRLDGNGAVTLELLDAQGRPVMRRSANGTGPRLVQMGTSKLSAGAYTLRVVGNGASTMRQVVLTH